MNSRVLLRNAYSKADRLRVQRVARPSLDGWSETALSLTLVVLLSLGLSAAIWEAVVALGSAVSW